MTDVITKDVIITGINSALKLQAIKEIRYATGLSLKESKEVADAAEKGIETRVTLRPGIIWDFVQVEWKSIVPSVNIQEVIDILEQFPRGSRIGDVLGVLAAVKGMTGQ